MFPKSPCRLGWIVLLLALLALPAAWAGPRVRVGLYQNAPKVARADTGRPEGIFVDLIEAIAKQEGWSLEYVFGTWGEGLDRLAAGQIDLMPDVAYSPAREQLYRFHREPVLSDWFQVYARRGSGIRSLLDLAGKRVAVLDRSIQQEAFVKTAASFDLKITILPFPDYPLVFRAITDGQVDAAITNRFYMLGQQPSSRLENTAIIFNPSKVFFAAPKSGNPALLDAIDRNLVQFKQNPRSVYYLSMRQWTTDPHPPPFPLPDWFKDVSLAVAALLLLSLLWSVTLKHQVAARTRELALRHEQLQATHERMKQTELALGESEGRFRELFENAPVGYHETDTDDHIVRINQTELNLLGYRAEEMVGHSLWEFTVDLEAAQQSFQAKLSGQLPPESLSEHVIRRKDGQAVSVLLSDHFVRNKQGGIARIFTAVQDITDRKKAEAASRQSEATLRSVFLAAPVGIAIVKDRVCKRANTYWCKYFGYTEADLIGKETRFLYERDAEFDRVGRELYGDLQTRGLTSAEARLHRHNGELRDVVITAAPIRQNDLSAGTVVIIHDITERKRAEEALRDSELRYRTLADSGQALIWTAAVDKKCNYFNQPWLRFTGRPLKQELGDGWTEGVHPDDLQRCVQTYVTAFDRRERFSMEYRLRHANGEYRWIQDDGTPRFDHDGKFLGYIGHCLDITGRKRAEEEREKLQAQLNQTQKMESIGRLAGGVAHDFNNMLAAILGHTELALDKVDPAHPIFDDLQGIQKAAERSADLTRQLLAFARKQTVAPQVIDLNVTVEGMLKMLRRLIHEGINLVWRPGTEAGAVKMDPSQFDQILANLTINARDAIGEVGTFSIATRNAPLDEVRRARDAAAASGEYVALVVSDTGCGMSPEVLEHLFEPFFTTKGIGEGTGLGLATVYGIIRQNHGFVTVDSQVGHGTTLNIYLPQYHDQTEAVPAKMSVTAASQGCETILLVEDEPAILNITRRMLVNLGYTVLSTATTDDAIRLATEHEGEIQLLLTDVVMPEMNGRDLARKILSLQPKIQCLFMSGYTADVIARHGVLDEDINFIHKPFSKQSLGAKIRGILDKS